MMVQSGDFMPSSFVLGLGPSHKWKSLKAGKKYWGIIDKAIKNFCIAL